MSGLLQSGVGVGHRLPALYLRYMGHVYLTPLYLNVFTCKMGIKILTSEGWVTGVLNWFCEVPGTVPGIYIAHIQ